MTMSACSLRLGSTWLDAMIAPITGMKNSAEMNEADMTTITIVGKSVMNLPMMPGQNSRGMKAASVVAVAPITGTNILCTAWMNASFLGTPSCNFRSAYSTTTTGSSTSTPTAITSPNMTIMLIVMPVICMDRQASMTESGVDMRAREA